MIGLKASGLALLAVFATSEGASCRGQSGGGEAAPKEPEKPTVSLGGVDTSMLTPREKREWSSLVSDLLAPCPDVPVSIAQCVLEKRSCAKCVPAAKYVLKGVRDGQPREAIEKSYKNRFDPANVREVPEEGSPARGPADAPITIVEFADFECPFCAAFAPVLDKAWEDRKSTTRFVFKFLPLPGHPHGEPAARAGIAAMQQGKFWEMHHALFTNRDHLEPRDLEQYARQIGLDVARFKADMQAQSTTDRIAQDKRLAERLDVKGTPTIYINGREFDPKQDIGEWIALELSGANADVKPAPQAAGSAAAEAGVAVAGGDAGPGRPTNDRKTANGPDASPATLASPSPGAPKKGKP